MQYITAYVLPLLLIILSGNTFINYIKKIKSILLKFIFISFSAQIFVFPLIIFYFENYNLLSIIPNSFGVIFIYPIVSLGIILLLPMPSLLSKVVIGIEEILINYFLKFLDIFSNPKFIIKFKIDKYFVIYYYLILLIIFFYIKYIFKKRQKKKF